MVLELNKFQPFSGRLFWQCKCSLINQLVLFEPKLVRTWNLFDAGWGFFTELKHKQR